MTQTTRSTYDVVVVGGGAAGLSGALTLARARRSVLVVDAGDPRNAPAAGVHGFLTRDGIAPPELLEMGRAEVRRYGGEVLTGTAGTVVSAARATGGFDVTLASGEVAGARRLLVTTGLVDELPDVPGVRERWGRDVIHCPYCHGWEVRDQALGILGSGPMAVHQALLFSQWSDDVTLFLDTAPEPTADDGERLAARGVTVVAGEVAALEVNDDALTGVRMATGEVVAREAVVVGPRVAARTELLRPLGLEETEGPFGTEVVADPKGRTGVGGVWVAGNVADMTAQVVRAAAQGVDAAAAINADLLEEDIARSVAHHHPHPEGGMPVLDATSLRSPWSARRRA